MVLRVDMFNALPIPCMSDQTINLQQTATARSEGKQRGERKNALTLKTGERD